MEPRIEDITSGFAESIVDPKVTLPTSFDVSWQRAQVQGQWPARGGIACCCLTSSVALFFGGGSRDGAVFNDILLVDVAAGAGRVAKASGPSPPARSGAVLVRMSDGEALLHGGADPASGQLFSDAWILSVDSMTWAQLPAEGLIARHALQAAALSDGGVLFIGGSSADGPTLQPQVLRRSGNAATVTQVTAASVLDLPARELFAAAAVDGLVLLHGGHCTDALLQTVTALDALTLEVVFTEDAPEARVAHAAVGIGGGSVMMYGGTNMLHPPAHDDCLMFDAGSKQWARGACQPLPDRFAHGMVACGGKVVVAGGINFETDLSDVWVADVPDARAVYAAAAAAATAAAEKGLESKGSEDQ